jgi:RND family efflux transporter MFP subunit
MMRFKMKKPEDIGLAIRRLAVFGLPALVIVAAITGNIVMGLFKPTPDEKEDVVKATPVVVAEAVSENIRLTLNTQGEALPLREIKLAPQVSGKIMDVSPKFIEGGAFEKDDVLLRIDPAEYSLRIVQAKSSVAQARSRYISEEVESRIARKDWEELGKGEGSALALREPQMAEAAALLASAEATLHEAELQLARTTIRAPFKGRISSKSVDIGDYVTPGVNLGDIFSTNTMQIALPLTDAELGQLGLQVGFHETTDNPGRNVAFTAVVAGEPHTWRGRIVRTNSRYDRETRVLFAYAEVDDPYGAGADDGVPLAAGLFVNAEIEGRAIESAVIVPRTALHGKDEVFIAREDNTLEIRRVVVASSDRTRAVLIGGVRPGEKVITSPVRGAADGMVIAVARAPEEGPETVADATN